MGDFSLTHFVLFLLLIVLPLVLMWPRLKEMELYEVASESEPPFPAAILFASSIGEVLLFALACKFLPVTAAYVASIAFSILAGTANLLAVAVLTTYLKAGYPKKFFKALAVCFAVALVTHIIESQFHLQEKRQQLAYQRAQISQAK